MLVSGQLLPLLFHVNEYNIYIGEHLEQHLSLLVDRSEVGGTGNVCAGSACPVVDGKSGSVIGYGSAKDRNCSGSSACSLESTCSVSQDQVNAGSGETGTDGGAVGGLAVSVLLVELNVVSAELLGENVLESLSSCVKSLVLNELADTDVVNLVSGDLSRGAVVCCAAGTPADKLWASG